MIYFVVAVVFGVALFVGIQFARKNPKKADAVAGVVKDAGQKAGDAAGKLVDKVQGN